MRRTIIAGNWKMNLNKAEALDLVKALSEQAPESDNIDVVCIPPYVYLETTVEVADIFKIKIGAQDVSSNDNGAYTGEVSARMLKDFGCEYVVVGHSERRQYHGENPHVLVPKIKQVLEHDMIPILCVGEAFETRENEDYLAFVRNQLRDVVEKFKEDEKFWQKIVIAYEPIWAIGTGKTATEEQAQEMCENLRHYLFEFIRTNVDFLDESHAREISILYGGSVKPENAGILCSQHDIDGFLVGGASLKADSFLGIINNSINK